MLEETKPFEGLNKLLMISCKNFIEAVDAIIVRYEIVEEVAQVDCWGCVDADLEVVLKNESNLNFKKN